LEPLQILRAAAPISEHGPAARGGRPSNHWPPDLLLHFPRSIGNRASTTDQRRDVLNRDSIEEDLNLE